MCGAKSLLPLQVKSKRLHKARKLSDEVNNLIAQASGSATLEDVRRYALCVCVVCVVCKCVCVCVSVCVRRDTLCELCVWVHVCVRVCVRWGERNCLLVCVVLHGVCRFLCKHTRIPCMCVCCQT
jgi:hypothetical protein